MLSVWMVCGWRNANVLSETGLPVAFMSQDQVVLGYVNAILGMGVLMDDSQRWKEEGRRKE
jgi:hypothetical protein